MVATTLPIAALADVEVSGLRSGTVLNGALPLPAAARYSPETVQT